MIKPGHPRLLVSDFSAVRTTADEYQAAMLDRLVRDAGEILRLPTASYEIPDGLRLLSTSREVVRRTYALALAWKATGNGRYLRRLLDDLEAAAAFPDWNHHRHFLDTAEMTHAFAVAYDWLFDDLSAGERASLADAIVRHGLRPGLAVYDGSAGEAGASPHWNVRTNNWNIVCNGGLVLGALAVADVEPELAARIVDAATDSVRVAVAEFAPDGGYPEGAGYWGYAVKYLALLLAALDTATGDDRGLADSPGLRETGLFPLYLTGPTREPFNYYDSHPELTHPRELLWFANRYADPVVRWWAMLTEPDRPLGWVNSPIALLWRTDPTTASPREAGLDLDIAYRPNEVVSSRSAWDDPDALWVAWKGGDNTTSHGDLDLGTFVLEAGGVRWAEDFGPDDYLLPGYWEGTSGGRRWSYYRKRAEGHNTLVVAPGSRPVGDQVEDAVARLTDDEFAADASSATLDLTASHERLDRWDRTIALAEGRSVVVLRDSLRVREPSEVWWFLHTSADIEVRPDGRSAVLRKRGRAVRLDLSGADGAGFLDAAARPLWTSPDPEEQAPVTGVRKLAIRMHATAALDLEVRITPVDDAGAAPARGPVVDHLGVEGAPVEAGAAADVRVTAVRENGTRSLVDPATIELHSSDEGIATAEPGGRIRGVQPGTVALTAILVTDPDRRLVYATTSLTVV